MKPFLIKLVFQRLLSFFKNAKTLVKKCTTLIKSIVTAMLAFNIWQPPHLLTIDLGQIEF